MNTAIIHRKERKAQLHKSLYLEEIIQPETRMPRINRNLSLRGIGHTMHALMIGRISTYPGAQRLEKAPEHGDAMVVCLSRLNNHREHRGHREKLHRPVLSVYSVVDQVQNNFFFRKKCKNRKPQINADERRFIHWGSAILGLFFNEQSEGYENYPN